MKAKKTVKRRSPAAVLAEPLYRKRVIKSAKTYTRKGKSPMAEDTDATE